MKAGVPKGKPVGEVMAKIKEAWFEDPSLSRDQAFDIVDRFIIMSIK